jgi:uncharacterized SAM-dependent methyltransferase
MRTYNDAAGITARFNLNALRYRNRVPGSDFRIEAFRHEACWVERHSRIEMHLVSCAEQTVHIDAETVRF